MINLLCMPSLFKTVQWVAIEMVRFLITQTVFFSGQKLSLLVGPCEQFGAHEKVSWERAARYM